MTSENPYKSPPPGENETMPKTPADISSAHAAYNIVSDTVGGLNVRKSDNLFQLKCIGASMLVLAGLGAAIAVFALADPKTPWHARALIGAMTGAFAGLVVGVFGSGIVLMIYRAVRHAQGKHE